MELAGLELRPLGAITPHRCSLVLVRLFKHFEALSVLLGSLSLVARLVARVATSPS
jgi:hypothetical protein